MALCTFRRGVVIIRNRIEVEDYSFYITSATIKAGNYPPIHRGAISLDKMKGLI